MQSQFDKFFWELVGSIPKKQTDIIPSFKEDFYEKLQTLQSLIDDGVDINIPDRSGSSYLETAIWISTFSHNNKYYLLFFREILYFLLFQDSIRPTISTLYVAASVCRNTKVTEEILKRCDDTLLIKLRNGCSDFWRAFDYLDPPIIEVFKGFRLR